MISGVLWRGRSGRIRMPNGEVEGPPASARSEPRVHTLLPHPRRHYRFSRPLQRLLDGIVIGKKRLTQLQTYRSIVPCDLCDP
jgi:hypothetical protein